METCCICGVEVSDDTKMICFMCGRMTCERCCSKVKGTIKCHRCTGDKKIIEPYIPGEQEESEDIGLEEI